MRLFLNCMFVLEYGQISAGVVPACRRQGKVDAVGNRGEWRNGRRRGLKIPRGLTPREGSIPSSPTYRRQIKIRREYERILKLYS